MKASRRRLNEEVQRMLEAGHSVKAIVEATGVGQRTVYRRRQEHRKQRVEEVTAGLGLFTAEELAALDAMATVNLETLADLLPPMPDFPEIG